MKIIFWIGTPSFAAYTASTYINLESIQALFLLSALALLVAILPRLSEARAQQ